MVSAAAPIGKSRRSSVALTVDVTCLPFAEMFIETTDVLLHLSFFLLIFSFVFFEKAQLQLQELPAPKGIADFDLRLGSAIRWSNL